MSQEFVTELDENEGQLNEDIDYLLDGIDFQQSLSQEKTPTCVPSSFPEENGYIQNESEDRDEVMSSPILFTPEKKEAEKSTIPVIQPFRNQQSQLSSLLHVQRRKVQFIMKILWTSWKKYLFQTLRTLI